MPRPSAALLATCVFATAVTLAQELVSSQGPPQRFRIAVINGREVVDGEVLVRYRANTGAVERERAEFHIEADEVEPVGRRGAQRVRSRRLDTRALLEALSANPDVEFVEPNFVIRLETVATDAWFSHLWGLFNSGQPILGSSGIAGSDIAAAQAWDITTGSRDTVIGVVDTGIDYTHSDLAANMWRAPRAFSVVIGGVTITCAAGTYGFNAITNTCNPFDDHSHGTHVAGTIGAVGNNGIGVAGVNWVASLMGLKFLSSSGSGTTANAIKAIEFAIQARATLGAGANVRILSNSWGGGGFSTALRNQIEAANNADMLFVAAAGNSAVNTDSVPHYPSSYTNANVISVAATTNRDQRASFSNWGPNSVDLGAPGQSIVSTVPNQDYSYFNGTSMATPHVAGVAALVLATCPRTTAQLRDILLSTVDPIAALTGLTTTGGRLNADAAVRRCLATPSTVAITASAGMISVDVNDAPGNAKDWVGLSCSASGGNSAYSAWKYLNNTMSAPSTGTTDATITFPAPTGPTTCNARLFLNNGQTLLATSNTVTIASPATLAASPSVVVAGSTVTVTVADSPGAPTDWIGLYRANDPDGALLQWVYLNGTRSAPPSGLSSATVQMTAPSGQASYNARLFANNSFAKLAVSNVFDVQVPPPSPPAVTVSTPNVSAGASIPFTVAGGPANQNDWVGLFETSAADAGFIQWFYLNGSRTAPSSGIANASLQFTAPSAGGTYEVRFFANNGFARLATSAPITVTAGAIPTVVVQSTTVMQGQPISFTVSGGPANIKDWVSLAPASAPDTNYVNWMFLNGQQTPPLAGTSGATLSFPAPATAGTYNIRFFADNGLTRLATSATVTVCPCITVPATTVAPGAPITFTISGGPANRRDWIGVFNAGAADTAFLQWVYLSGSTTPPVAGLGSATLQLAAPATPGSYNLRLFADDGYTKLVTSAIINVVP